MLSSELLQVRAQWAQVHALLSTLKVICNTAPASFLPVFTFCSEQQSFHRFSFTAVIQGFGSFQHGLKLAYVTKSELE